MKPSILSKLETLSERMQEISALLSDPGAHRDQTRFRDFSIEYAQLSPVVACFQKYQATLDDIASAQQMLRDDELEMRVMAQEELLRAQARQAALELELQTLLLPTDPNDNSNIFLEIRAGTGGDEAALFAGDLSRMYSRLLSMEGFMI